MALLTSSGKAKQESLLSQLRDHQDVRTLAEGTSVSGTTYRINQSNWEVEKVKKGLVERGDNDTNSLSLGLVYCTALYILSAKLFSFRVLN